MTPQSYQAPHQRSAAYTHTSAHKDLCVCVWRGEGRGHGVQEVTGQLWPGTHCGGVFVVLLCTLNTHCVYTETTPTLVLPSRDVKVYWREVPWVLLASEPQSRQLKTSLHCVAQEQSLVITASCSSRHGLPG